MTPIQVPTKQKRHPQELSELIRCTIAQNDGWIGFDEYMQSALYTPGLGYYSGTQAKFGAEGDFITAPEMGDLFAKCLAAQTAEILQHIDSGQVLEFGAGSGALAASLLNELDVLGELPEQYLILELSGNLRVRQQETIRLRAAKHFSRVTWLDSLPEKLSGVVIANEVLDAMPVKLFEQRQDGSVSELGVCIRESTGEVDDARIEGESAFAWQLQDADAKLDVAVTALALNIDRVSYRSEINFQAQAWIKSLAEMLESGVILLVDYGFPQAEYYHPDRDTGTLMCHYRHRAHDDAFFLPGQQDITAHVDFTAIATAAVDAGLELEGYATQGSFLLSAGLLDNIQLDAPPQQQILLAQQLKKLTMPHEMGELFKVLALSRNFTAGLSGFAQQNQAFKLTRPQHNSDDE